MGVFGVCPTHKKKDVTKVCVDTTTRKKKKEEPLLAFPNHKTKKQNKKKKRVFCEEEEKRERERERERDDDDTGGFSSVLLCSIFQFQNKSAVQISYVSTLAFTLCYVLLLPSLD